MTDRLAEILRATGRRPEVPHDRADRVEEAVRAHWRAHVASRRRRRRASLMLGVGLAATVAGIVIGYRIRDRAAPLPGGWAAGRVEAVTDSAWLRPGPPGSNGPPSSLRLGDEVAIGSELATLDRGRIALRMSTGHSLRLDEGTHVRLLSRDVISLEQGAVYVDSHGPAGVAAGSIEIRTPLGGIREIGTQFEVRWIANSLRIRVREGGIAIDDGRTSFEVVAGKEVVLAADGNVVRHDLDPFGSQWAWVGEITPMLTLQGRSVGEFLDWIARERGLTLQFATPELAAAAPRIRLNGSIEGMTLDQALESVLPTCRMSHRIEGHVLLIRSTAS